MTKEEKLCAPVLEIKEKETKKEEKRGIAVLSHMTTNKIVYHPQ